ncbi:hypothetical protein BHM03_00022632 [Ensete ventricosum]|nr:hypothetical protein BHM03_00022632 [Ensete ventricosum]
MAKAAGVGEGGGYGANGMARSVPRGKRARRYTRGLGEKKGRGEAEGGRFERGDTWPDQRWIETNQAEGSRGWLVVAIMGIAMGTEEDTWSEPRATWIS